jgi:hypothetical protein
MVLDDKDVHSSYDLAVWVNTDLFSNLFMEMTENTWQKSKSAEHIRV